MDIDWAWETGFVCGAIVFVVQQGFLRWATMRWWQGFAITLLLPGFSAGLAVIGGMALYAVGSAFVGFEGSFALALVLVPGLTLFFVAWRSYGRALYLNKRSVELGLQLTQAPVAERDERAQRLAAWAIGNESKSDLGRVSRVNAATALHLCGFDDLAEDVLEPLADGRVGELRARIAMARGEWADAKEKLEAIETERRTDDVEELIGLVGVLEGDEDACTEARETLNEGASATQRLAGAHAHARTGDSERARAILDEAAEVLGDDFWRLAERYQGPASILLPK